MQKFKLVKKVNPAKRQEPKKWYTIPLGEVAQNVKAMTRAATANTTTASIEMEAAMELFGQYAVQQLQQGHTVRLGNLGTLRISFKSDGVEDITKFNASKMIHDPRVVFTPTREFANSVISGLRFQNAGVLDEHVSYASLTDYKIAKGIITPDSGTTEPGGGEQGGGEDPDLKV